MTRRASGTLGLLLLVGALGCQDDAESPSAPQTEAALATGATGPLLFRQVSAGGSVACGVTTDNVAYCWSVTNDPYIPAAVPGGLKFREVSLDTQDDHICGVTTHNVAYCWGDNETGQLGDGTLIDRPTPTAVTGGRYFRSVTAGTEFTCGRNGNDHPYCWGNGEVGQLGDNGSGWALTPVRALTGSRTYPEISAGVWHACGVTAAGQIYCWGRNDRFQLGDGTQITRRRPTLVPGTRRYRKLDSGVEHTCALSTGNLAYCWGDGAAGALGDGTRNSRSHPVQVAGGLAFQQLSAGSDHTCAVTFDNRAYCWGIFVTGQVNNGMPLSTLVPVAVMTDLRFTQISIGEHLGCGVTPNAQAYCWGLGWGEDGSPHLIGQ